MIPVEELMLGDWVKVGKADKYHGYIGRVRNIGGPSRYVTLYITTGCEHDVFFEDLEPIPVTGELLEQNGFAKNNKDAYIYNYLGPDGSVDIVLDDWYDGEWSTNIEVIDKAKNQKRTHTEERVFLKVHQLQHALKECETGRVLTILDSLPSR